MGRKLVGIAVVAMLLGACSSARGDAGPRAVREAATQMARDVGCRQPTFLRSVATTFDKGVASIVQPTTPGTVDKRVPRIPVWVAQVRARSCPGDGVGPVTITSMIRVRNGKGKQLAVTRDRVQLDRFR
jgi:hypothetical protein